MSDDLPVDAADHMALARWVVGDFLAQHPELRHLEEDLLLGAQLGICEAAKHHDGRPGGWGVYAHRYAYGHMIITLRAIAYPVRPAYLGGELRLPVRVDLDDGMAVDTPAPDDSHAAREVDVLMDGLTPRQREVIERRYGLSGRRIETVAGIACALCISPRTVRRIEVRAMRRLRAIAARGDNEARH